MVDEYDKPLIDALGDEKLHDSLRSELRAIYGVLKKTDQWLHFTFLTGVTKFSQVNIFSDLNHPDDISMNNEYANICGMTAEELANNFEPELWALAKANDMNREEVMAEMKARYDGYSFCRKVGGIYNPFSILNTLKTKEFRNYWFRTGTPTFLVKSLAESNLNLVRFNDGITVNDDELTDYRAGSGDIVPLLYQSGYLTIKSYADGDYTLGFPNAEVRYGFTKELFNYYVPAPLRRDFDAREFVRDLHNRDVDGFMRRFQTFFSSIPYDLISQFTAEAHYQGIVFVAVTLMGQYAAVEIHSSRGRSDLEITLPETQYIIEFKLSKKQDSAKEALAQIKNKGYTEQYMVGGRQIVLVGAVFDPEKRNIVEWTYE
ncbi:MAG: ATP-binding protein [Gracilibacteraceae bacterium]|nr:ATP-binding protein [Gracilibacteraceae bacterium]